MIYCFSEFFPENSIFEGQENEEGRHWGQVIRIPMGRDVRKTKDVGGVSHAISQSPQWATVCCGLSGRLGVSSSNLFFFQDATTWSSHGLSLTHSYFYANIEKLRPCVQLVNRAKLKIP